MHSGAERSGPSRPLLADHSRAPVASQTGKRDKNQSSGRLAQRQEVELEFSELGQRPIQIRPGGLHAAVREGSLGELKKELGFLEAKSELDWLDGSGFGVLHEAARFNHSGVVKALLDHGAHIDVQSKEDRITPLHIAARLVYSESITRRALSLVGHPH